MDILGGGLVGRPAQEIGKLFDVADILVVRLGAEPADRHVLDQSPAERTDGPVGHWGLLSWVRSSAPRSQDRTPASATPRDPRLAAYYRGSGLVHRNKTAIVISPSEAPPVEAEALEQIGVGDGERVHASVSLVRMSDGRTEAKASAAAILAHFRQFQKISSPLHCPARY